MADDPWDKYIKDEDREGYKAPKGAKPTTTPDPWDKYVKNEDNPDYKPPRKREYSMFEHLPGVGKYVRDAKISQNEGLEKIEAKYPGFLEKYDSNRKMISGIDDFGKSMLLTLLTKGNIHGNAFAQSALTGGQDLWDRAAEKGPANLDKKDVKSSIASGAGGWASGYAGQLLSPTTRYLPIQDTFNTAKRLAQPRAASGLGEAFRKAGVKIEHADKVNNMATRMADRMEKALGSPINRLTTTIIGGLGGGALGGLPYAAGGALVGALVPTASRLTSKLINNRLFSGPIRKSLVTAAGATATGQRDKTPIEGVPYDINMGLPINAP
jgi:hypothetical protein